MELRMVARRTAKRSMTVLGDLAQATSAGAQTSWVDALSIMSRAGGSASRLAVLELGYRVPAPILEFANRLLPTAAPGIRPSRSVRIAGEEPTIERVGVDQLLVAVAQSAAASVLQWRTTGVIGPEALLDEIVGALKATGLSVGDARRSASLDESAIVLGAVASKGLEFDSVIVVEPAEIVAERASGERALYVALTRAVQRVVVVHAQNLPAALTMRLA